MCKAMCMTTEGCEFYSVVRTEGSECNCTLKTLTGVKAAMEVTPVTKAAPSESLKHCDLSVFVRPDVFVNNCNHEQTCVYELTNGATWAMTQKLWDEVDATNPCWPTTSTSTTTTTLDMGVRISSTHRNNGKAFDYKGRTCYQNEQVCDDMGYDCCVYHSNGGSCRDGYDPVWESRDCDDSWQYPEDDGNVSTYANDGGSFFCCEKIRDCKPVPGKCNQSWGTDCCAPPYFLGGNATTYLDANCEQGGDEGLSLEWILEEGGDCAGGGRYTGSGKYRCCSGR